MHRSVIPPASTFILIALAGAEVSRALQSCAKALFSLWRIERPLRTGLALVAPTVGSSSSPEIFDKHSEDSVGQRLQVDRSEIPGRTEPRDLDLSPSKAPTAVLQCDRGPRFGTCLLIESCVGKPLPVFAPTRKNLPDQLRDFGGVCPKGSKSLVTTCTD